MGSSHSEPRQPQGRRTVAVVLTGGRSARMGADKATLELGGKRLVDHVVAACLAAGLEVRLAGRAPESFGPITLPDPPDVAGPAAGLAAAMRAFPGADIVLVATDQPYVRPATLDALLALPGAAVVPVDVRRQTLCALYRTECADALEQLLEERGSPSLQTLLDRVGATEVARHEWEQWGEDGRSWTSLDTPERLTAAVASWPEPPVATIAS